MSSFIQRDVDALSTTYEVRTHQLLKGSDLLLPLRLIGQLAWLVMNTCWRRDVVCHFSGYHAVLPSLLCRRSFIILAGSDCAGIPAIGYGDHIRWMKGWATRFAARHASRLLPVHGSLIARENHYDPAVPPQQGLRAFEPRLRTPVTVIPYGFDPEDWTAEPGAVREPLLFVCVCGPARPGNRVHRVKGVDLILELANALPQAKFLLVGLDAPEAYAGAPANLLTSGRTDAAGLRRIFSSATYYLQPSITEGMPNALCEAMLCGCIPIVSDVASMPDIVGGTGAVIPHRTVGEAMTACTGLMALDPGERERMGRAARERIVARFDGSRRLAALLAVLERTDEE